MINLKHKLEQLKSPLINDLMICLRELMKDYKHEVHRQMIVGLYDLERAVIYLHNHSNNFKMPMLICNLHTSISSLVPPRSDSLKARFSSLCIGRIDTKALNHELGLK